jgi:diguanylate cyclase (GGDEF)-like protein
MYLRGSEVHPLFQLKTTIPEGTYVELVQSLYRTLMPTLIMAVCFVAVAIVVSSQTADPALTALAVLGSISIFIRVVILLFFRGEAADANLNVERARQLEFIFALGYLTFAAILGMFSARAFVVASPDTHVLIVALLVGYAAGVAAGIAYRPWISVAAMLIGVIPTIAVSLASQNSMYQAVGALLLVLLAGGVQSMLSHYRYASGGITMMRLFEDMAESDVLTGLPNRLGLGKRFNDVTMVGHDSGDLAVHCLDLDRFKPINDSYGHPVGDLLLKAVSQRLSRTLRGGDFAARVGGDEFVIVQRGLKDSIEAKLLGERVVRVISEPYRINDLTIIIGTSIGFALVSEHGHTLDKLIAAADEALLRAKAAGGGRASRGRVLRLAG